MKNTKTKIFEEPEKQPKKNEDSDKINSEDTEDVPIGRTGILPGGGKITVRNKSQSGWPTLEIIKNGKITKFIYTKDD